MEAVLATFFAIFLLLFSALTLTKNVVDSQTTIQTAQRDLQTRMIGQAHTLLLPVDSGINNDGSTVSVTLQNKGDARLSDFDKWDVVVHYADAGNPASYHINWLPYNAGSFVGSGWAMTGIYQDAKHPELGHAENGVVNSGEQMILQLQISPSVAPGVPVHVYIATPNGIQTAISVRRDDPPILVYNVGITVLPSAINAQGTPTPQLIDNVHLLATDKDDGPNDVTFNVTIPPTNGVLSLGSTFTQTAINSRTLTYTPIGDTVRPDTFTFTVSDHRSTIGAFTFVISTP